MIRPRTTIASSIADDVFSGLTSTPKALSPKLFYDAVGSDLFDAITELPEYYLTRTEQEILNQCSPQIVSLARVSSCEAEDNLPLTVIELGAGSATKTRTILHAVLNAQPSLHFRPLDVSPSALEVAAAHLREIPGLMVTPIVADYTSGLPKMPSNNGAATRNLVLYIGSSIGNFEPMQATAMLTRIRRSLQPGDTLLLGTDLVKDKLELIPAYDDAAGVTAAFNKNVLARINRELGGHFDLDTFRHVALWNADESRVEMHLESVLDQKVTVDDIELLVHFSAGERIHTENSYKFTTTMVESILHNSGFNLEYSWVDKKGWYALHLARV